MREIKFRVWSGKQQKMFYLAEQYLDRCFMEIDNQSWGVFDKETYKDSGAICNKHYKDDVLMQYTGLRDKNGKEIFEGDILRLWKSSSPKGLRGEYLKPLPVIYDENWCQFVVEDKDNKKYFGIWQDFDGFEVIGNIYDNPKLLEGDNHDTKA